MGIDLELGIININELFGQSFKTPKGEVEIRNERARTLSSIVAEGKLIPKDNNSENKKNDSRSVIIKFPGIIASKTGYLTPSKNGNSKVVEIATYDLMRGNRFIPELIASGATSIANTPLDFLVLENLGRTDLRSVFYNSFNQQVRGLRAFDVENTLYFLIKSLEGLKLFHDKGIIVNDIKPTNMFIGNYGVKITDFGLVIATPDCCSEELIKNANKMNGGTPIYLRPENISKKYDKKGDVYTLGLIVSEMISGLNLDSFFQETDQRKNCFTRIFDSQDLLRSYLNKHCDFYLGAASISDEYKTSLKELLWDITDYDYDKRPSVDEAISRAKGILKSMDRTYNEKIADQKVNEIKTKRLYQA